MTLVFGGHGGQVDVGGCLKALKRGRSSVVHLVHRENGMQKWTFSICENLVDMVDVAGEKR